MNGKKKIFLVTILSLAFVFGMSSHAFGATPPSQTDLANAALQKAEADLETAKKALTPAVFIQGYLVYAKQALVEPTANNIPEQIAQINVAITALNNAATKVAELFPPPTTTPFTTAFTAAVSAVNTAMAERNGSVQINNPYFTNAKTAAKNAIDAALVVRPPSLTFADVQAAIAAAEIAVTKAKAAIPGAVVADEVAAKSSIGGLQGDAADRLNPARISNPAQLIGRFINMLLAFIGSISLVLYIVAGFLWMTASGNTEKVTKAKSIMVWTTLGVLVMLASYMLVSFVFKSLGV